MTYKTDLDTQMGYLTDGITAHVSALATARKDAEFALSHASAVLATSTDEAYIVSVTAQVKALTDLLSASLGTTPTTPPVLPTLPLVPAAAPAVQAVASPVVATAPVMAPQGTAPVEPSPVVAPAAPLVAPTAVAVVAPVAPVAAPSVAEVMAAVVAASQVTNP